MISLPLPHLASIPVVQRLLLFKALTLRKIAWDGALKNACSVCLRVLTNSFRFESPGDRREIERNSSTPPRLPAVSGVEVTGGHSGTEIPRDCYESLGHDE